MGDVLGQGRLQQISNSSGNAGAEHAAAQEQGVPGEPRALSFAEIKELIEQGKTDQIPNNRVIPDELSVRPSFMTPQPVH